MADMVENKRRSQSDGLRRFTSLTPRQMSTTKRRLTPFYNSDPTPNPSLGRGLVSLRSMWGFERNCSYPEVGR